MTREQTPILVLTLPDDEARRAPLIAQLNDHGLAHDLVEGVDGRRGLAPDHAARIDRAATEARLGRALSDAEYACALSHIAIWQRVAEGGPQGAIVLEDDATILPAFAEFVRDWNPAFGGLVLLAHLKARVNGRRGRRLGRLGFLPLVENCYGAYGYALAPAEARALIAANTPVWSPPDWPADLAALGALVAHPMVVSHAPVGCGPSHLETDRSRLARLARRKRRRVRWQRFFKSAFWQKKLRQISYRRIS